MSDDSRADLPSEKKPNSTHFDVLRDLISSPRDVRAEYRIHSNVSLSLKMKSLGHRLRIGVSATHPALAPIAVLSQKRPVYHHPRYLFVHIDGMILPPCESYRLASLQVDKETTKEILWLNNQSYDIVVSGEIRLRESRRQIGRAHV